MKTIRQILPIKKSGGNHREDAYIRIGLKAFYLSNEAMKLLGDTEYIRISLDRDNRMVIISKAGKAVDSFKLSKVCETQYARRIETNRSLLSLVRNGFPLYMVDRYLPVSVGLDGSLNADFSALIPLKEGEDIAV